MGELTAFLLLLVATLTLSSEVSTAENLRLWWESVGEPSPGSAPPRALSLLLRALNVPRCQLPCRMCLMT